tara:strand:+ start:538 stop:1629 length:1092 start_codon:yes stop_codon:yes gene_type:complete
MYLSELSLVNFKNIKQADFQFSPQVNCFLGNNGQGKTNLLDAIYYLSYTKSFFNSIDSQNVNFESDFFVVQGKFFDQDSDFNLYCAMKKGDKKVFRKNKKVYKKLSDHIGVFPVVMITPYDINLILEGSDTRRKFVDALISQFDNHYLSDLLSYNKLLKQRNVMLKDSRFKQSYDLLEVYESGMSEKAMSIFLKRKTFIDEFTPIFNQFYIDISSNLEQIGLEYESSLNNNSLLDLFELNRLKDQQVGHTTAGIHRDDLVFTIQHHPIKKFGSQGQQKTYLIALKLAKYEYIRKKKNMDPVLLLDDIFDKLDDNRVSYILDLIRTKKIGQCFITDTSTAKIPNILSEFKVDYNLFEIENGAVN